MKKSLLTAILMLTLLLACSAGAMAATYTDTAGHWAENAIEKWSALEVIQGDQGLFRPDDGIRRGEMALIIDRVMKYGEVAENPFSDLPDTWYTEAVLKLNAAGVMLGAHGLARPEDGILREEAMVMIARAMGMDMMFADIEELPYGDAASISDWAYVAIAYLTAGGYITDSPEVFRPQEYITRAEVVTVFDNIVKKLWRVDGLYNASVQGNTLIANTKTMLINSDIDGHLIIAGGLTEKVILEKTNISGQIINKSGAEIITIPSGSLNSGNVLFRGEEYPALAAVPRNSYRAKDFYIASNNRLIYDSANGHSEAGVDVSEHQADIDWQRVAADGIEFAFIRLGYRGYTEGKISLDLLYQQNMAGAQSMGLDTGVYFFSQAISVAEAVEEANFVIANLAGYSIDLPVVFDWEAVGSADARTNNISQQTLTDCAIAFCETIAAAGYQPMLYLYGDLAYVNYDITRLTAYPWWFAGYSNTPDFYYHFDWWQYTSSGKVDGIEGRADLNIRFVKD